MRPIADRSPASARALACVEQPAFGYEVALLLAMCLIWPPLPHFVRIRHHSAGATTGNGRASADLGWCGPVLSQVKESLAASWPPAWWVMILPLKTSWLHWSDGLIHFPKRMLIGFVYLINLLPDQWCVWPIKAYKKPAAYARWADWYQHGNVEYKTHDAL
jgi:hypothetical protein